MYTVERAMRPEAPTATVTLLVKVPRRLKAGLFAANEESEATAVFALSEISEGAEPSTNESPHNDCTTGLAVVTVEGASWAQILYASLLQFVQVTLAGKFGGFWVILTIFPRVSGPVIASILVRVSVTHRVLPCLRQTILRTVGYNVSISAVREDNKSGVIPADVNSVEQPVVMFWMTAAIVALVQAGAPHKLVSQLLIGWTSEVFDPAVTTGMRAPIARH